jgi:2'-5' RNA ligase
MRTFLAVDISEEVRSRISDLVRGFRNIDPAVKWVDPGNMHITLFFFGEVDETTLKRIEDISGDTVRGLPPFAAEVGGMGGFPSLSSPRVVWAGVKNGSEKLGQIYGDLRDRILLERLPVPVEKRGYTPHLTLARIKRRPDRSLLDSIEMRKEEQFGSFDVHSIVLYKSTLTRQGPLYERLRELLF